MPENCLQSTSNPYLNKERKHITLLIKRLAIESGFSFCGISPAALPLTDINRFRHWLENSYHGEMHYMGTNTEKRTNPALLVEQARSVIVLLYNYYPGTIFHENSHYRISKYAWNTDYHLFIKKKLSRLIKQIRDVSGALVARGFTDSAPVLEKVLAQQAGLGWTGKNTCLINRKIGSFFFIAEIITDLELEFDPPSPDYCGTCTRCIDACPTGALVGPYILDARRCISYHTIENKGELPVPLRNSFNRYIFGCDICQDVCPWNRFATIQTDPEAKQGRCPANLPDPEKIQDKIWWDNLTEEGFHQTFRHSALKRTGYTRMLRNIDFIEK
jgi:epoxyqueuosine reductase